jgi:hypothetical protein
MGMDREPTLGYTFPHVRPNRSMIDDSDYASDVRIARRREASEQLKQALAERSTSKVSHRGSMRWRVRLLTAALIGLGLGLGATVVQADGGSVNLDPRRIVSHYTQCGGESEGKRYPDNHTVSVLKLRDPDGFHASDLGRIAGQCGNISYMPDSTIQTLDQIRYQDSHGTSGLIQTQGGQTYVYKRRYPQCGGEWGPGFRWKDNHTVLIEEWGHPSLPSIYAARNVGPQSGQCGNP